MCNVSNAKNGRPPSELPLAVRVRRMLEKRMGLEAMSGVGFSDVLSSRGSHGQHKLLRPSGWTVVGDTNTGIGFGAFVQAGGGYMEMDVRDMRTSELYSYELRGAYNDIGIGVEAAAEAKWLTRKIMKAIGRIAGTDAKLAAGAAKTAAQRSGVGRLAAQSGLSTDAVVLPGGSMTPLILGFDRHTTQLNIIDFQYSTWMYLFVGGELGAGADVGIMWLMSGGTKDTDFNPMHLFINCLAFAPYYGVGVSVGAGVKLAVRIINIVSVTQVPYSDP